MDVLPSTKFSFQHCASVQAKMYDRKHPVQNILLFYPFSFTRKKREKKKKNLAYTRQLMFILNTISKQPFTYTLTLEGFQVKVPPKPKQLMTELLQRYVQP